MKILAFDTATPATAVALWVGGEDAGEGAAGGGEAVAAERAHLPSPGERPGHATQLLPLANALLDEAGLFFADLDRIAVGVGPGTFTGLRIGVSTARALAQGAGADLVGISTLRALAVAAGHDGPVLAVLDARRGEAFAALYEGGEERAAPAAMRPEDLAQLVRPGVMAVGDGAVRFRAVLEPAGAAVPDDGSPQHTVSALTVARLAERAEAPADGDVVPEYLRLPDAEIALRARQRP